MSTPSVPPAQGQWFQVERHGDVAVIIPSPEIEKLPENQVEMAAQLVLAPLKENPPSRERRRRTNCCGTTPAAVTSSCSTPPCASCATPSRCSPRCGTAAK